MDDSAYGIYSIPLQKDSEFLYAFNHYILKQLENGLIMRNYKKYFIDLYVKEEFGMTEAQSLGFNNVMSLFVLLALGICTSLAIAAVELIVEKLKKKPDARSPGAAQEGARTPTRSRDT